MNIPSQVLPTAIHGAMAPCGRQHEFARLEMTNVVVSKHSCSDEKWQVFCGEVSGSFGSFHDEDLKISDVLGCFGDLNWIVIFFFETIH